MIFLKRRPLSCDVSSRCDSVVFCGLRKPTRFSGGGGGSSRIFLFRGLQKPARFSGGGVSTMNFPLMGPFYIFTLSQGGGRGPRAPRAPRAPSLNRPLLRGLSWYLKKKQGTIPSFVSLRTVTYVQMIVNLKIQLIR